MRASLIVTTYNRPDALALVLDSIFHQRVLPDEIVVADDGSGDETRRLIDVYAGKSAVPVLHAWHEDRGFRAARIRNIAVLKSTGDYLIFLDGDMVVHRRFVDSHLRARREGCFLHGKRAMLSDGLTHEVLERKTHRIPPWLPGVRMRVRAIHCDPLAALCSYRSKDWFGTQSANLSCRREDFYNVNGFNIEFEGWGLEDSELALRLMRSGLQKIELRFCAAAFHLAHGKDNKQKNLVGIARNEKLVEQSIASGALRCRNGLMESG